MEDLTLQTANLDADKMFFEADQNIKDGKISEALGTLLRLVERYPAYGRAYNHLGFLMETRYRDFKRAESFYQKALQYAPEYPAVYLNYAALLSTMERFQELEQLLNKALSLPGVSKDRIYNEFGIMNELQGKYEDAIDSFRKVIRYALSEQEINNSKQSIERCKLKMQEEFQL